MTHDNELSEGAALEQLAAIPPAERDKLWAKLEALSQLAAIAPLRPRGGVAPPMHHLHQGDWCVVYQIDPVTRRLYVLRAGRHQGEPSLESIGQERP